MRAVLILLMVTCATLPSVAQRGSYAGAPFRMGASASATGFGNAGVAGGDVHQADANPALSAFNTEPGIELSSAALRFDRSLHGIRLRTVLPPSAGLTIGFTYAGVGDFDGRTVSGYPTGRFGISEMQLAAAFGIRVSDRTRLGAGMRISRADYGNATRPPTGVGLDLGLVRELGTHTRIGIAVTDLIAAYTWDTQELYGTLGSRQQKDRFPTRIKLGVTHRFEPQALLLAVDLEQRVVHATFESRELNTDLGQPFERVVLSETTNAIRQMRTGLSWQAHDQVVVRGGWQVEDLGEIAGSDRISFGFTLDIPQVKRLPVLDYAFSTEAGGFSSFHQFAFRFSL